MNLKFDQGQKQGYEINFIFSFNHTNNLEIEEKVLFLQEHIFIRNMFYFRIFLAPFEKCNFVLTVASLFGLSPVLSNLEKSSQEFLWNLKALLLSLFSEKFFELQKIVDPILEMQFYTNDGK